MQDLGVDCDRLRVRRHAAAPEFPPILVVAGAAGIFGLILLAATTESGTPITTGILGGKVVVVKHRSLK